MSTDGSRPLEKIPPHTRLLIEATVASSEDSGKVLRAAENLVGEVAHTSDVGTNRVRVASDDPMSLSVVHDQLRDRHVRGAARRMLLSGRKNRTDATIMLNRQAALQGVVALCSSEEESPLGPIYLTIRSDDLDSVMEWLTAFPVSPSSSAAGHGAEG